MLENNTRRKIDARIMSIMLTLVMCFSVFAIMPENSYAASVAKVKGLKVKSVGCDTLKVSWSTAKGAKKYKVYLSTKSKSGFDCVATTTSKSITGSKLKTGTKYYIKVRGVTTYKQKQYYHSKKKKWVTSKPSKKYIKDTRTVTKEKYGS
ncbi:MAG: fibronectin type III domain-containing protein, partial [Bacillota bacterium]|nr:fibronectin type III domain-containing protein [Bacillota bacterium]